MIDRSAEGAAFGNSLALAQLLYALVEQEILPAKIVEDILHSAEVAAGQQANTEIAANAMRSVQRIQKLFQNPSYRILE